MVGESWYERREQVGFEMQNLRVDSEANSL